MADILIKGLELPTEERISLSIYPNGIVVNHSTLKVEKSRTKAIELPPHGRLIDADKVKKKQKHSYNEFCENVVSVFDIDHAPTILEAST